VAFIASGYFANVLVRRESLKVFLNMRKGELNDPLSKARDVSMIRHWATEIMRLALILILIWIT